MAPDVDRMHQENSVRLDHIDLRLTRLEERVDTVVSIAKWSGTSAVIILAAILGALLMR